MAGKHVNNFITNWQWTGSSVQTPQATVDLELQWTNEDGSPGQWAGIATFPNDLQLVPVAWIREELEDLLIRVARHQLGID